MNNRAIPQVFLDAKRIIDDTLEKGTSILDAAAETIVQNVFRIKPAKEKLSDQPEEVQWLEGERTQLKYHRDHTWAVPKMWAEMTAGAVGSGSYIFGVANSSKVAQVIGWGLGTGVKGILLWADLGRPDRIWKVFAKPNTSWISRGSWAFAFFAGSGAISLLPLPDVFKKPAQAVAVASGAVLMSYDGLFLHDSRGIPAWTDVILPPLFVADAIQAGSTLADALAARNANWLRCVSSVAGVTTAALHGVYVIRLQDGDIASQLSARDLIKGRQANRYLIDSLLIGTIIPTIATLSSDKPFAKAIAASSSMLGTYSLRRAVLQSGIHAPVKNPPRSK